MDTRCITLNNEAVRIGSERMISHLRSEGLSYDLWVTGTASGSTVHLRVADLTDSPTAGSAPCSWERRRPSTSRPARRDRDSPRADEPASAGTAI